MMTNAERIEVRVTTGAETVARTAAGRCWLALKKKAPLRVNRKGDLVSTSCRTVLAWCVVLMAVMPTRATADGPLVLARDGRTDYVIVIAENAKQGERDAARELALWLGRMTGAQAPIVSDTTAPQAREIIVGDTNRKALADLPATLRTENLEGFSLVREDQRLLIMGNIPRGTLYGVYDLLDVELGVRFLAHAVTHVPRRPTLELALTSRTYGPPLERRTIWEGTPQGNAIVRNRLNGLSFQVVREKVLGGVKMVGRPTHTYNAFVPPEKYFDEHPEYFGFVDGERRAYYKGLPTQLCVSNPEVLLLSLDTVRNWLAEASEQNPYNKYVVSVSANDTIYSCRCAVCLAINREEGISEQGTGGAHVRFLNAIARQVAREFPHASVKTMFYHMELPRKTKPAPNVILENVTGVDWRYPLDDLSRLGARYMTDSFKKWRETVGDGSLYVWTKHIWFHDYFLPNPNLRYIAHNLRIMTEKYRVKGMFAQNTQSNGSEFQTIRYYLLARAMWRPQSDSHDDIEEFCRLYYGPAGSDVLRYINYLHDDYGEKAPSKQEEDRKFTRTDEQRYIEIADTILAQAEAKVDTPSLRMRVATLRLPVWKMVLKHALADAEQNPEFALTDRIRTAGQRFMRTGRLVRLTHLSENYQGPNVQTEMDFYRRIRLLLRRDAPDDTKRPWINDDAELLAADLGRVRHLDLCGSAVTDAGVAHVAAATRLETLDLRFTLVTDEGLAHLAGLGTLEALDVGGRARTAGREITNAGVAHLAKLGGLRRLTLTHTRIGNDAMQTLGGLVSLQELNLSFTGINDEALKIVASLTDLAHLELCSTNITDAGLEHLHALTNLEYLNLFDTAVSDAAVASLQRALPQTWIRQE